MASEDIASPERPVTAVNEVIAYTKKELEADDAEQKAKLQAASAGALPSASKTGATLDLSHRGLSALPVEIVLLIKDRVERLALSHNPQITLPTQIVQCNQMRYLNIRWNQLRVFPPEILGLKNLEILDLSKNRIVAIPEEIKQMSSLKFLAVERNRITRLPLALGEMPKLQKMIFEENPIEFPPPEALRPDPELSLMERQRELCSQVKVFMKLEAARIAKLRLAAQETPRPPVRPMGGGRFPIRPRDTSVDLSTESATNSPDERSSSSLGQRTHTRDMSSAGSNITVKRPSVAPLITTGHDGSRNRSETASSSASLKSRRQGFVPSRRPTGEFELMREASDAGSLSASSANKEPHWHEMTPTPDQMSLPIMQNSESEGPSPIDGPLNKAAPLRSTASLQRALHSSHAHDQTIMRAVQRLYAVFEGLNLPFRDVVVPAIEAAPSRYQQRHIVNTSNHVRTLGQHLERVEKAAQGEVTEAPLTAKAVYTVSVRAMKNYALLIHDLKANSQTMVEVADAMQVRGLMFQLHYATIELRNICALLGFKAKRNDGKLTSRSSTWSNRTVTPTQPSRVSSRRMRGATILRSIAGDNSIRAMAPPMPQMSSQSSRSSTAVSTPLTAKSGDSFAPFGMRMPSRHRSNTLLSTTDESDNDQQQFERIFPVIKTACEIAVISLPHLRQEILARKEKAQSEGQSIAAREWDRAYTLNETVMANDNALLKRLKTIRLNDPGIRTQPEFWQMCDRFALSWAEFLSLIKNLSTRKIDIGHIKPLMRNVQKAMKELTHTVSQSPLYQQAVGATSITPISATTNGHRGGGGGPEQPPQLITQNLGYPRSHATSASSATTTPNGYATSVPATPLSAALGPAAQATIANSTTTSNGFGAPREYYPAPPPPLPPATARMVHERVDTVIMPPGGQSKR